MKVYAVMAIKQTDTEKGRTTRARVPTSCFMCRKRKRKCDKIKPFCTNCITNGNTDKCTYEKHPWMENGTESQVSYISGDKARLLQDTVEMYQKLDVSPIGSTSSNTSNNFSNTSSNSSNTDTQATEDDATVGLSKAFDGLTVKESVLTYYGPTSYMSVFMNDSYSRRMFHQYTQSQLQGYREQWEMPYSKTPCSDSAPTQDESKVVSDLPPLRIVTFLVETFFETLYPFAPFINKSPFMEEMKLALAQTGNRTVVTPQGKQLHSTIALVLIMMRFSFLTLPFQQYYSNSLSGKIQMMMKEIVENQVDIRPSYIGRANILVSAAGCFSNISLRAIQAALLLRTYKLFCPEGNDGGTESSILIGSLIQMARFHGLHRNPDFYKSTIVDVETKHLWRKIWAQLLYLDASQSFNLGSQLMIYEEENFPFLEVPNFAITDEPLIVNNFAVKAQVAQILRNLIKLTTKDGHTKKSMLLELANTIESLMCNKIRVFEQLYIAEFNDVNGAISSDVCDRALEFCLRLDLTYKLYIIYFLLYSSSDDLASKENYFSAAVESGLIILRIGIAFCDTPHLFFGAQLEKVIAQNIFLAVYRTVVSLTSIVPRIIDGTFSLNNAVKKFTSPDSAGLVTWLNVDFDNEQAGLHSLLTKFQSLYFSTTNLASTYFLCYRVSWGMKYVLDYVAENYPSDIEDKMREEQILFSDEFSDIYSTLGEMWNSESVINFDYIFASLGVENLGTGLET